MSILIIGPTSVGKSAYIKMLQRSGDTRTVLMGSQIKEPPVPSNSYVHYNLLHRCNDHGPASLTVATPDTLLEEPILSTILHSGSIRKAAVLVAPRQELLSRMQKRDIVEEGSERKYQQSFWTSVLQCADLFRIYEALFELLDQLSIPYEVIFSSGRTPLTPFVPSDRTCVHKLLRGGECMVPSEESTLEVARSPFCEYQTVVLPHAIRTVSNYSHLDARESFLNILPCDLAGKTVLDIGSAIGGLLVVAERLGAGPNVGIELGAKRFTGAQMIKKVLSSDNTFIHGDFLDVPLENRFDYVFALNVIHHINDYFTFLKKACSLAAKSLIIEYPTVQDKRFASYGKLPANLLKVIDECPFIGVSSSRVDQTYTFTRKAMDSLVEEKIGGFRLKEHRDSSIGQRVLSRYDRLEG